QRGHHRRDLVAERAVLLRGPDADRDHRAQLELLRGVAAGAHVAAEPPGDGGEDHVVDGPAELVLDVFHVRQRRPDPGEAAVRADVEVEWAPGGGDPGPSEGAGGEGRLGRLAKSATGA